MIKIAQRLDLVAEHTELFDDDSGLFEADDIRKCLDITTQQNFVNFSAERLPKTGRRCPANSGEASIGRQQSDECMTPRHKWESHCGLDLLTKDRMDAQRSADPPGLADGRLPWQDRGRGEGAAQDLVLIAANQNMAGSAQRVNRGNRDFVRTRLLGPLNIGHCGVSSFFRMPAHHSLRTRIHTAGQRGRRSTSSHLSQRGRLGRGDSTSAQKHFLKLTESLEFLFQCPIFDGQLKDPILQGVPVLLGLALPLSFELSLRQPIIMLLAIHRVRFFDQSAAARVGPENLPIKSALTGDCCFVEFKAKPGQGLTFMCFKEINQRIDMFLCGLDPAFSQSGHHLPLLGNGCTSAVGRIDAALSFACRPSFAMTNRL
ncbi:hypothetical protein [Sinorhizobium medicae]|uniref:hypothetical protein n=1 Tax=Sinorhizobium medicae TaxID=110321 RepID=UPI0018658612|nr:hypothetical protein [Sinorhizobium medicae]